MNPMIYSEDVLMFWMFAMFGTGWMIGCLQGWLPHSIVSMRKILAKKAVRKTYVDDYQNS